MPDHLAEEGAPARETLYALLAVVQTGNLLNELLLVDRRHGGGSLCMTSRAACTSSLML